MFGIGMPELMLIFVLALLVFGPKELPKIARTIGKAMAELRRASDELRDGIQREIDLADRGEEPPVPPPEGAPSTTFAQATPSPPEAQPTQTAAGGPAEVGGRSSETASAEAPAETIASTLGEQPSQTTPKENADTAMTSAPPKTDGAKGSPEVSGQDGPQAESASHAPAKSVETRNA